MIDFAQYLSIARRWWWLLALSALLGAGVGLTITTQAPPMYRASASLLVRTGGSTDDYSSVMASEKMALTYENLLTKRPVIELAAGSLGLSPDQVASQLEVQLVSRTLVIELGVLDRDPNRAANIANAVLAAFIRTQQESGNVRARDIAVVEYASPPSRPVSPNATRTLLLASAGGLLLSTGVVWAFELAHDRLEGMADVRRRLSIPVLAVVPRQRALPVASQRTRGRRVRARERAARQGDSLSATLLSSPYSLSSSNEDRSSADESLPAMASHRKPDKRRIGPARPGAGIDEGLLDERVAEAYLTLRTWLQFSQGRVSGRDRSLPSLVITSPRSQRDNGLVAINLGVALALADLDVVLVDADLREPSLHQLLGGVATETTSGPGLSDLLAKGGNWRRHLVETRVRNLSFLPAGKPAADPLRLFSSLEMARLLRQLRKEADVVLLNASPVLAAADALILAAQADATMLVIENRMSYKWAAQALGMLQRSQANVLGAILTRVRLRPSDPPPHCDFGQLPKRPEPVLRHSGMQVQTLPWDPPALESSWRRADGAPPDGRLPVQLERMSTDATLAVLAPGQSPEDLVLRAGQRLTQEDRGNSPVQIIASEPDLHA